MVKSRPRETRAELAEQVNLLASQFGKTVGLGGRGQEPRIHDERMSNWRSTSSRQLNDTGPDSSDSVTSSVTPAKAQQPRLLISIPKYSTLGFEVDLTGSQMSDTPFLLPMGEKAGVMACSPKFFCHFPGIRADSDYKRRSRFSLPIMKSKEDRFKKRRDERLRTGFVVNRLVHSARQKVLAFLSQMDPGSIEQIKNLDPSGNGELRWGLVKVWLESRRDLTAQMNLTTKALHLIATNVGRTVEARSLQVLKHYAIVVCKWDAETYRELCSFLFPEDDRFSPQGVC